MIRAACAMVFTAALCLTAGARADEKGPTIDFDGLKSVAPGTWKEEEPSNRMRYAQFKIPRAKGDPADGELVIFKGLGGSAKQNIERWKGQFLPPTGKSIDDVAKVTEMKIAGEHPAMYLDVEGTYKFKERPFDPMSKEERRPDYRMVAVHLDGPKNIYHIRLVGPAKTVGEFKKGFDEWLKAFK